MLRFIPFLLVTSTLLVGAASPAPPQAVSAVYVVNTWSDTNAPCTPGSCSLRAAITAANANPGLDTITFSGSGSRTYPISLPGANETQNLSGDLNIKGDLIITGSENVDITVDGGKLDRVFYIDAGATVTITGIIVQNGQTPAGDNLGGGGILNRGTLTLDKVKVQDNLADQGAGISNLVGTLVVSNSEIRDNGNVTVTPGLILTREGGGIYSDGPLNIYSTFFQGNKAESRGGGLSVTESGEIEVSDVVFEDNFAAKGGAVYNDKEILLFRSKFFANHADQGGAIYNDYILNLEAVLLENNTVTGGLFGEGGGIYNEDSATANLTNVTLSGNLAENKGGAVYNRNILNLTHVTFYGNQAPDGGALYNDSGARAFITNTIFKRSGSQANCTNNFGSITSRGNNLEDGNSCGLSFPSDIKNTNPLLALLADDAKTGARVHALQPGSPAFDSANQLYCAEKDARGVFRSIDGDSDGISKCDIGAVEQQTAGWVSFSPASYGPAEEGTTIWLTVARDDQTNEYKAVTVDYRNRTSALYDFVPFSGTLSWGTGDQNPKTFQITILNDEYKEPDKYIEALLTNALYGVGVYPDGIARVLVPANDNFGPSPPFIFLPLVSK